MLYSFAFIIVSQKNLSKCKHFKLLVALRIGHLQSCEQAGGVFSSAIENNESGQKLSMLHFSLWEYTPVYPNNNNFLLTWVFAPSLDSTVKRDRKAGRKRKTCSKKPLVRIKLLHSALRHITETTASVSKWATGNDFVAHQPLECCKFGEKDPGCKDLVDQPKKS